MCQMLMAFNDAATYIDEIIIGGSVIYTISTSSSITANFLLKSLSTYLENIISQHGLKPDHEKIRQCKALQTVISINHSDQKGLECAI